MLKLIGSNQVPQVISWKSRKAGWKYKDPSGAVDSTVVDITMPREHGNEFVNKRRNGKRPFIFYQVVVAFGTHRCVRVDGPFKGGCQDYTAYRDFLMDQLDSGETIVGDAGYYHARNKGVLAAPGGLSANMTREDQVKAGVLHSARQVVERYFARFKRFGIMSGVWRYGYDLHSLLTRVVLKMLNMELHNHPL